MQQTIQKQNFETFNGELIKLSAAKEIIRHVLDSSAAIINGATMNYTLDAWFKEYIKSPAFAQLPDLHKEEAFETFCKLHHMIIKLDDCFAENNLSDYSS
jgi:hypothetical protein